MPASGANAGAPPGSALMMLCLTQVRCGLRSGGELRPELTEGQELCAVADQAEVATSQNAVVPPLPRMTS